MPGFRPNVADRSGEILAQGINSFGQSIGAAIGQVGQQQAKAREEADFMRTGLLAMADASPGLIDADTLEKFESGSLGAKRGIFTQAQAALGRQLEEQEDARRFQQQKDLIAYRESFRDAAAPTGPRWAEDPFGRPGQLSSTGHFTPLAPPDIQPAGPPAGLAQPVVKEIRPGIVQVLTPQDDGGTRSTLMNVPAPQEPPFVGPPAPPPDPIVRPIPGTDRVELLTPNRDGTFDRDIVPKARAEGKSEAEELGLAPSKEQQAKQTLDKIYEKYGLGGNR